MKAGCTHYLVGTPIRITYIASADDQDLVGRTGTLTHPFGDSPLRYLGVWLDPLPGSIENYQQDHCSLAPTDRFVITGEEA